MTPGQSTYWATRDPDWLAKEVMSRWKDWRQYYWMSGIGIKADKGRRYFYGLNDLGDTSSRPQVGGNAAQFLRVVLNEIRPVVQRVLAMIAAQAPTMTPVAANSDAAAREQASSAKGILEHVHREHNTEALDKEVLKIAMVMGEAWRLTLWDATKGDVTAVEKDEEGNDKPVAWLGDFMNRALSPFDVARDPSIREREALQWLVVRVYVNRWELAAQYPEKAEAILAAREHDYASMGSGYDLRLGVQEIVSRGDAVPVFHFFHVDSKAVPGGRVFACLNEGTWLVDGPNPYDGLPCEPCFSDKVISTTMGYTNVFDALGVADRINALKTTIFTHTVRWGTRPIIDFTGSGLQYSTLGNGTSVLTVKNKDVVPQPLDVPPIPPEVFKDAEDAKNEIANALGMNQTAMGNPPFSGMAAQAMALLDQKAREYQDNLAASWTEYKQGCATRELKILQKFANEPRMALIEGKASRWKLKSWSKEDLQGVALVSMEPTPAGTGTMAWKWAMAEMLQKFGVQLPAKDLVELMRTGEYEDPFESDEANRLRIKEENEGLMEGKVPPILMARTHWLDIPEHLSLLRSPDIDPNGPMATAVLQTVSAKLDMWRTMPLDLLQLLGGPPPPSALPPPMPGAPGGPRAPEGAEPQQPVPPPSPGGPQ